MRLLVLVLVAGCGVSTFRAEGQDDLAAGVIVIRTDLAGADLSKVDLTMMSTPDIAGADLAGDMAQSVDMATPADQAQPPDLAVLADFAGCLASGVLCAATPGACCQGRSCNRLGGDGEYACCVPNAEPCQANGDCCGLRTTQIACIGGKCCVSPGARCENAACCDGYGCKPGPFGMTCQP